MLLIRSIISLYNSKAKNNQTDFDVIKIISDVVLYDKNGNVIEVKTPRPEYLRDSLL